MNTKPPRSAPYPVGTKVKYVGSLKLFAVGGSVVQEAGMMFEVVRTRPGQQGTGQLIVMDDDGTNDDYDDDCYDETQDGCSVVELANGYGRCIDPDSEDWEPVE